MKKILSVVLSLIMVISTITVAGAAITSENDTETEITKTDNILLGDVNGDGSVTAGDARLVLRVAAHLDIMSSDKIKVADYNTDGYITAMDARCIIRLSAHLDPFGKGGVAMTDPTTTTTTKAPETTTKKPSAPTVRKYTVDTSNLFSTKYTSYAVLYDYDNDKILYGRNMHSQCHPASTTKLMTAYVACQYLKGDYVLTVGNELNLMEWNTSRAGIYQGQRIKFKEILKCMLVPSGCDAAYTIAVNTARVASGDKNMSASKALSFFISMMNTYAKRLGMNDSHFANPDGFPDSNHYVSAYDMMIVGVNGYNIDLIKNVVCQSHATAYFESGGSASYTNSNELLNPYSARYYPYVVGMKTGSHSYAGQCLVSVAKKNGRTFFGIVMHCSSKDGRYSDLASLYNTAFSYFWR